MKKLWLLVFLLALSPLTGSAQTTDELVNDGKNRGKKMDSVRVAEEASLEDALESALDGSEI